MNAIYLCFDDGALPCARACLNSLAQNAPGHPPLLVDYRGADAGMLRLLAERGATRLPAVAPPEFTALLRPTRGRDCARHRFGLWRRAFDGYGTILHLDADMLVLGPLYAPFAARQPVFVANHEADPAVRVFESRWRDDPVLNARLAEDGLPFPEGPDDMANAGFFALPAAFRTRAHLAGLARLAERYARWFAYADQSLLSLWLSAQGLRPSRDFRWNFQTPFFTDPTVQVPFEQIRVLHFSSPRKPGTRAFARWDRAGPDRNRIEALFCHYRDMAR
ncbi:hypothetical protein [Rhodovulum euryhalinum]|uniref:Glycosyl transferase family 8 n=1 Tax=Rhodovulum euryhalinum TaxID=35805 RepID=A0A4R2KZ98_9RHOB|nr:hypothetical protein [Rhodovulum euryhalinum]TCO72035.1 hypothetical protein EV655_105141 [Rhodovulum euryhalinum]